MWHVLLMHRRSSLLTTRSQAKASASSTIVARRLLSAGWNSRGFPFSVAGTGDDARGELWSTILAIKIGEEKAQELSLYVSEVCKL